MPRWISLPPRRLPPKSGMAKAAALGKGLSALMGNASKLAAPEPVFEKGESIRQVSRSNIVPSPLQPRKTFRPEELTELVDSIKERGIIQPLIVRLVSGKYELIAGERRWRAAGEAGLETLPDRKSTRLNSSHTEIYTFPYTTLFRSRHHPAAHRPLGEWQI